jgi:hypothetical protein
MRNVYRYCSPRWIWLKEISLNRYLLKSEAPWFLEESARPLSYESPLKISRHPVHLLAIGENSSRHENKVVCGGVLLFTIYYMHSVFHQSITG